jgi:sugar lactone lactonase YvrE
VHAFVHSLHLAQQWAYCVDLPAPFGEGPAAGHAITLSPDGSRLYVVDASSGSLAEIDPDSLTIASRRRFDPVWAPNGEAAAAVTPDGRTLLVGGRGIAAVPVAAGGAATGTSEWSATPSPVRGLAVAGDRVYLGQENAVVRRDPKTGRQLGHIPVPGLVRLRHVTARPAVD